MKIQPLVNKGRSTMNNRLNMLSILILIAVTLSNQALSELVDHWGHCAAVPAVVNPAETSSLQEVITLSGEWEFVTDPRLMGRHRMGKGPDWNEPEWNDIRAIMVPGCWEAQGVGEPGMSQPWDLPFDRIPRPINHMYMGTVRYRRSMEIPESWADKRIWLKVGGVRTEAWFWVNQQRVAHLNTYCGTYKYDITDLVKAGETAEIVATLRNDTPSRKGCMAAYHRFGGFYRDIELEATPQVRIEDVWVRSDIDKPSALVAVDVQSTAENGSQALSVDIQIKSMDGVLVGQERRLLKLDNTKKLSVTCEVKMSGAQLWTPETPTLYSATVTLLDGDTPIHGWKERFGLRKLEVRGDRFYLNNQPFLARGFGDDYIYPLTLISPPDREFHKAHLLRAKEAGFNYVRLHTHCEIPEYYEAADEVGILLQPELPYYHDITPEGFEFDPMRDLKELYRHYRRYVSFASYSLGNEGYIGAPLDQELYQWAKANDPDRIFQHQDGGCNQPGNTDYYTPNGYGLASSIVPWEVGAFDSLDMPFISHEYLNLGIKMDPRIAPQFTGVIPCPRSMEDYEASLEKAGLDRRWGDACLNAAHGLQGYYQKQGIEQARLDPACDGYSYWTIVDVMVEQAGTYTGQGFLNAFWEEKEGGLSLEQFRQFNGPTALLATFNPDSAIAVSGDECSADLWISHFDHENLEDIQVSWKLASFTHVLAEGVLEPTTVTTGEVKSLGSASFSIPELEQPIQAFFVAKIDGHDCKNLWMLWLFPKRASKDGSHIAVTEDLYEALSPRYTGLLKAGMEEAAKAQVVIGSWQHPEVLAATEQGKQGLMVGPAEGRPNVTLGWWSLGDQIGTAFADHPALAHFPHSGNLTPLWFRLIKKGIALPLTDEGEWEYIAVGEGQTQYFAYIMEKKDPDGRPFLMTHGVDLLADTPEGAFLLDAMVDYLRP